MLKFLFWNVGRKALHEPVAQLAREHEIDVVAIAEQPAGEDLSGGLRDVYEDFRESLFECDKINVYYRSSRLSIAPRQGSERVAIGELSVAAHPPLLFAAAHLVDPRSAKESSRALDAVRVGDLIRDQEVKAGHTRTLLVGDLNMNPFEPGVTGASAIHAVMTRELARGEARVVGGVRYPFFYNPMWGYFGDVGSGPPGTYYRRKGEQDEQFWHIYDQVLVRPSLLDQFPAEHVRIIDEYGGVRLTTPSGLPDAQRVSDHLPLTFALDA